MLKDLDSSDEQFSKLQGKRDKYYEQLKQTPEWEKEGPAIERREDLRRKARQLRETANRAEKVSLCFSGIRFSQVGCCCFFTKFIIS